MALCIALQLDLEQSKDLQEFIDKDTTADEEDIFYEEFTSKY